MNPSKALGTLLKTDTEEVWEQLPRDVANAIEDVIRKAGDGKRQHNGTLHNRWSRLTMLAAALLRSESVLNAVQGIQTASDAFIEDPEHPGTLVSFAQFMQDKNKTIYVRLFDASGNPHFIPWNVVQWQEFKPSDSEG